MILSGQSSWHFAPLVDGGAISTKKKVSCDGVAGGFSPGVAASPRCSRSDSVASVIVSSSISVSDGPATDCSFGLSISSGGLDVSIQGTLKDLSECNVNRSNSIVAEPNVW